MKIVHVTAYYPPHVGGQETVVKQIAEQISKKYKVEVITSNILPHKQENYSKENLRIHYCKAIEFGHSTIIFSLFFRLLFLSKEDIVHVHVSNAFVPEMVYLVSIIKKYSYIAHIHIDTQPSSKLGILLPLYKKYILSHVLKGAKYIIVPTKDYVELIKKRYSIFSKKIVVIPNGINISDYSISKDILHKPIQLLFVGRLSKQKNILTLIKSFGEVLKKYKEISLSIVGDGEEKQEIKSLIKDEPALSSKIILHGALSDKDLHAMYANSDIFILPSTYESFGVVLLEAMASKLPIIASNIDAIKNIITNNQTGLLVEPYVIPLSQAIVKLISDKPLRERLKINGYKEVRNYSWDIIIPRFELLYQNSMK